MWKSLDFDLKFIDINNNPLNLFVQVTNWPFVAFSQMREKNEQQQKINSNLKCSFFSK